MLKRGVRRISLRTAIMLPFAAMMLLSVALMGYAAHASHERLLTELSHKLIGGLTQRTHDVLVSFLTPPFTILRFLQHEIAQSDLYRPGEMEPIEARIRALYDGPFADASQISVISFGGQAGEFIGLRREDGGGFTAMASDRRTGNQLRIHVGPTLDTPVLKTFQDYDPRIRPWYRAGLGPAPAAWSAIYTNLDEKREITVSAVGPARDRGGATVGVIAADVKLAGISRFLQDAPGREGGAIFIVDRDGRLVARSGSAPMLAGPANPDNPGLRLKAGEIDDPLIRAVAPYVGDGAMPAHEIASPTAGRLFMKVTPFTGTHGLDWRIVVVMTEADLTGTLRQEILGMIGLVLIIAITGVAIGLFVIQVVIRPILRTAQAANTLARGEWRNDLTLGMTLRETALLVDAFNDMSNRLHESFRKLRDRIVRDPLTGLLSRPGLSDTLKEDALRQGAPEAGAPRRAAVLMIGLDGFRSLNNSIGYTAGNLLLTSVAHRLVTSSPPDALVARVEGDEFSLVIGDPATPDSLEGLGRWALELFAQPFRADDDEVVLSACVGLAGGDVDDESIEAHLRHASVALAEAKRRGPRSASVYQPAMMIRSVERTRLIADMSPALARNEFRLLYQPVVDLTRGNRVIGAEALLRWNHSRTGMISPDLFIPLAEESGQILDIGEWVLFTACTDIAARLRQGWPPDFDLHVNVSMRQVIQSGFVETVGRCLDASGLPPTNLTLEITETALATDGRLAAETLTALRRHGIRIAIDDFGTGYSSLSYLTSFPFDGLKIDRSFIRDMAGNGLSQTIVHAIVGIASSFSVHLVAEGVETVEQAVELRGLNCGRAQGYLFGRPKALEDWACPA